MTSTQPMSHDKVDGERQLQAQQLKEAKALNEEKDKDLAKSKALVREYQATNKQLTEFLHQATERASDAEEKARVQAAHVHSKSGSIGILTTGSDIPDPVLQGELNRARTQIQQEKDLNNSLLVAAKALETENAELRRLLEELRSSQRPITPPAGSLPQQPSPLRDSHREDVPPSTKQARTSAAPLPTAVRRTYTPIQDYQWMITKDYFTDLEERPRKMYMYEREMFELSRLIPKEHFSRDMMEMDKARVRAKIEKDWADFEFANPEQTRGGYLKPATMYDKSIWQNQPAWREKWMKTKGGSLKIYYESPRDMRIDPTYCPTKCRYSWADFKKKLERNPNLLNFPRVASPQSYLEINKEWMAEQCETVMRYYEGVPDFTIVMFCKFLRLIHTLLTCFEKEKKVDPYYYKYNLGDQELAWDLNLFSLPQQVHGLYERVRYLRSPYLIAFEEMMITGFWRIMSQVALDQGPDWEKPLCKED